MTRIPFNRFVTHVQPYLNALAGGAAAWLVAKVDVLGLPHLDQANTQTYIAGGLAWLVVHGGAELGRSQWLKGHHIELTNEAIAPLTPPDAPPIGADAGLPPENVVDDAAEDVPAEQLPDDTEEFTGAGAPPPASAVQVHPGDAS